ncbi:MAG TPA: ABC transporter permease [Patescibacteria group bacterium]|nr:ABC transporter permease [Patescibacteria group bacterium]
MNLWTVLIENGHLILTLTGEHLWLVGASMAIALAIGIPAGILLARRPRFRPPVLGTASAIETIPSLALFGFLLSVPWIEQRADRQAITALALYALLPIIQNTYSAIAGVDPAVREAARAMGMTRNQILRQVELPLALPVIIGGVRVATVLTVGIATIAPAIGAGGLGELIFRGIAMVDNNLILAGAIPAALLALAADFLLGGLERRLRRAR